MKERKSKIVGPYVHLLHPLSNQALVEVERLCEKARDKYGYVPKDLLLLRQNLAGTRHVRARHLLGGTQKP